MPLLLTGAGICTEKQGWSSYLLVAVPVEGAQQKQLPEGWLSLGQALGAAAPAQC